MSQLLLVHLIFILFFHSFCFSIQDNIPKKDILVFFHKTIDKENILRNMSENVLIADISFESDIVFQQEEFFDLLGFQKGDVINSEHIIIALEFFAKKNKFSQIKIIISKNEDKSIQLHFIFKSEWIFRKAKIHKIYKGKHLFKHLYILERGEIFDESKHDYCLCQIKDFLMSNGYFDAKINSFFEYDNNTKEVITHISIEKGVCFCFGSLALDIIREDDAANVCEDLGKIVRKKVLNNLSGQFFTKDLLNAHVGEVKNYLAKKGFLCNEVEIKQKVDYASRLINIEFNITIQQKRAITFFGHHFFSKQELLNKILAFGYSVWLLPASLLEEEIMREYKKYGFLDVQVKTEEEKEHSFFVIKEGNRAIIKKVEIKNGTLFNQDVFLKRHFKKLMKHRYFDEALYEQAISSLSTAYVEEGFLGFTVVNYEFIPTMIENEYILVLFVDEGVKKYITHIKVAGYPELEKEDVFKKNDLNERMIFDLKIIEEQRVWLTKHFQSLGYLHPRCKPLIESEGENVSITWIIEGGEKVHFGKTIIIGSNTFPFSYLKHFLFYKEGSIWNPEEIKRSFRALKDLEIFETIHFSADHTDTRQDKPLLLKLHMDDRYEVRARAGLELQHVRKYQTFTGLTYKIGGTTLIKNPTNSADQLRFDFDFARSHQEVVCRYRRPWFTTNPFFTSLQIYHIVYDQPGFRVDSSVNDIYTVIQNGFFVGIQKKTKYTDIGWNNGCEWMKLHIDDNEGLFSFAQAIDFEPHLIDKTVPFFFTEPTIMLERLDDVLNPTKGGICLFSLKMMIPIVKKYKDSFFFKGLFEQSFFIPMKKVVAALRFRCGHIFYREFSGIMPSERFYLGGSHSLRGYEADLAPPLGIFTDDDGKQHVVPRGGKTMLNVNIELRFPVWRKIGGVVFQDLGALSGTMFADFKTQDLLASTGFGIRVFTPLGPLRFDIGWRWRKQLQIERSFAWFLTFGQAF